MVCVCSEVADKSTVSGAGIMVRSNAIEQPRSDAPNYPMLPGGNASG